MEAIIGTEMNCNNNPYISKRDLESLVKQPVIHTVEEECTSRVYTECTEFHWKIEQWDAICPTVTTSFQPIRSPLLISSDENFSTKPPKLFCELWQTGDYLSLNLFRSPYNGPEDEQEGQRFNLVDCHFELLNAEGNVALETDGAIPNNICKEHVARSMVEKMQNIWRRSSVDITKIEPIVQREWLNFIRLQDLFDGREKYLQNKDNALHLCVKVKIVSCVTEDDANSLEETLRKDLNDCLRDAEKSSVTSLSNDIATLFMAGYNADFVVQCGGKSFPVHKPILVARSKKLYQVLMSLMSSKQTRIFQNTDPVMTNSATLVDIEPEVVQAMLEYIYKGTISGLNRVSQLIALLKEGIKYGIEGLKRQCLVQMLELMDVDNALEISSIVEAHGPEEGDILDFVLKFIDRMRNGPENGNQNGA